MFAILELTVTLGNVITIVTTIIAAALSVWRISMTLAEVKWQVDMMWRDYKNRHGINGNDDK